VILRKLFLDAADHVNTIAIGTYPNILVFIDKKGLNRALSKIIAIIAGYRLQEKIIAVL
jgi:hypothetical protein